MIIIIYKLLV